MTRLTDKLEIILQTASRLTETPIHILIGTRRTRVLNFIRTAIVRVSRAQGFSWREIGSRLKRHRTTIMELGKFHGPDPVVDSLVARITDGISNSHFLDPEMEALVWNLAQEWISRFGKMGSVHLDLDVNGWMACLSISTVEGDIKFLARAIHPKPWVALLRAYNQAIKDINEGNIRVDSSQD